MLASNSNLDNANCAKYTMAVCVMLTGVPSYRIRRFEDFGLISPLRTNGKQRLFSEQDVALIREISSFEGKGVNLPGVRTILDMKQNLKPTL